MSTLSQTVTTSKVATAYVQHKNVVGLILDKRFSKAFKDVVIALRNANQATKNQFKVEIKDFFYKLTKEKFDEIITRKMSVQDIIDVGVLGVENEHAEQNIAKAIRFAEKAFNETSRLLGAMSKAWGYSMAVRPKQMILPCYKSFDGSTQNRWIGVNGYSDPVEVHHVSIEETYKRLSWGVMNKMMEKLITDATKVKAVERWKALNKEIVISQYLFSEDVTEEWLTIEVANGVQPIEKRLRTKGSMTAFIENLEQQIFQMENPVDERGEEQTSYAHDVRGLNEKLANIELWRDRTDKQIAFRDEYENVMVKLIESIKDDDSDIKTEEARKAKNKINPYEVMLKTTKELSTRSFTDSKGVEVYLAEVNYKDKDRLNELLRVRAIENFKAKFFNKERQAAINAENAFEAFGF